MARMLGRTHARGLKCAIRFGRYCRDCGWDGSLGTRAAKRLEAREAAAEIWETLSETRPRLAIVNASYPRIERDPEVAASYATLADGEVARTVEVTPSVMVDADAEGRPLGVEVIGDGDWRDGLVALAMQGRLRVAPASSR